MAGAGNNVYQQAAGGLQQAGQGTLAGMRYNPMQVQPGQVTPQTLAGADLGAYQNPYTSQVINSAQADLERQRQMAMNTTGAQFGSAGAFGGARHALAEAETNRGYADIGAQMAANLRNQGFQQAVQGAQFDIGNNLNAGLANQSAGLQAGLANQSAGLQGNAQRLGAASQLGGLANLGFGMGQQVQAQQAQQGAQQQQLMQQIIDAAKGQFQGFTGQQQNSIAQQLAALGGVPYGQTQTTSQRPGLFNFLSLALGL